MQVFTNRQDERHSFDSALTRYLSLIDDSLIDPQDLTSPRRNVLTYYGVGGVGKSALSRQLEHRCIGTVGAPTEWPDSTVDADRLHTVRIDMSRENGLDFETVMLLIRSSLCSTGQAMVAFDLAFARYWEIAHPNQPIESHIQQQGSLRASSNVRRLPDQLRGALAEAVSSLGVPGLSTLADGSIEIVRALRDRSRQRSALARCIRLPHLLEAEADLESLSYFPHLLAWDLHELQRRTRTGVVVFIDTFEDAATRRHRDVERLMQRLVWLMPNVLFVITGRNRLDWDDPHLVHLLDWAGPVSWPGLADGQAEEPRQHLVGNLSPEDSERYLLNRVRQGGGPAIPEDIRHMIRERSHGLPLYLDLSVMRFIHLSAGPAAPTARDFDASFPAIVSRLFRDLQGDERQVMRAASMLDGFSVDIVTAGAGLSSEAAALRLTDRPFIQFDSMAQWPFHMHALVRSLVRDADRGLDDSWSTRDWHNAAQRMLDQLALTARTAQRQHDRRTLISCLNQGMLLAHEHGLPLGWLVEGAFWYVDDMTWEPTLRPRISGVDAADPATPTTPAQALASGLAAVGARQRQPRQTSAAAIERVLSTDLLDGDLADLLRYFHAECLRELRRPDESEQAMYALMSSGRRIGRTALRGYLHMLRQTGRFREARDHIAAQEAGGVWPRMLGDIWWLHARFDDAIRDFDASLRWALEQRVPGEIAISASSLHFVDAFQAGTVLPASFATARGVLETTNVSWARRFSACAGILAAAGDASEVGLRTEAVVADCEQNGVNSSAVHARFAQAFHCAVVGDTPGLLSARGEVRERVTGTEFAYLCEIVDFWLGDAAPDDGLPRADWIGGVDAVRRRWLDLIARRRAQRLR
ncbi:ATP/GTP-binding protein [Streptomyces sp. NPDC020807]|uniref:ATP/GTP-binding protein n=1 Tax=Streptomyces sp. NPDC020807 TaxID=3155119 RepID=UPI003411AFDA